MRICPMLSCVLATGLCVIPIFSTAQNVGPGGAILTDKDAYILFPPQLISAPDVRSASWSSDGRYVLLIRQTMNITPQAARTLIEGQKREAAGPPVMPPPPESSIAIWSERTRQTETVWRNTDGMGSIEQVRWLPDTSTAIAIVRQTVPPKPDAPQKGPETVWSMLYILGETARYREIARFEEPPTISFAPTRGLAILQRAEMRPEDAPQPDGTTKKVNQIRHFLRVLRDNGTVTSETAVSVGNGWIEIDWSVDGARPYLRTLSKTQAQGQPARFEWYSLDMRTGGVAPLKDAPATYQQQQPDRVIRVRASRLVVKEAETTQSLPVLWLESAAKSEQPRAIVAAESGWGELSPRGDAVLYIAKGAAWITPLMRVTKEEFFAARRKAEITVKVSNAKQLGLGLLMYAQDYDETLPAAGSDVNALLTPYLKNTDLFDGFSYTFPGGGLASIQNPSETQLGFVTGPGGRAIIYADGHVKWQDDR